jgi:CRP/FNR family transcriptional regulator, cyclic AMP receptor protein
VQEERLRHTALFAAVPADRLAELAQLVQRRRYPRGAIIFHKGDPGTGLYLLTTGQVKIVLPSETGEEAVLGVLQAGDAFGELALFDGLPRSATVVALQDAEVLLLRREDFLAFVARSPEVATALLGVLSRRLRATNELIEDVVFLDVPGRLAKRLLDLGARYGKPTDQGIEIDLRLTQQELAAMVGTTRESVNKQLGWLGDQQLIALDRQRIVLLRPEELRRRIY